MKDAKPHDVLDMTLPPELREVVTCEQATAATSQEQMEKPMPETPVNQVDEKAIAAVVEGILAAKDSKLAIPDRPGHGMAWDEQAVKRYALD